MITAAPGETIKVAFECAYERKGWREASFSGDAVCFDGHQYRITSRAISGPYGEGDTRYEYELFRLI